MIEQEGVRDLNRICEFLQDRYAATTEPVDFSQVMQNDSGADQKLIELDENLFRARTLLFADLIASSDVLACPPIEAIEQENYRDLVKICCFLHTEKGSSNS